MEGRPHHAIQAKGGGADSHAEAETGVYAVVLLSSVNLRIPLLMLNDACGLGGPHQFIMIIHASHSSH